VGEARISHKTDRHAPEETLEPVILVTFLTISGVSRCSAGILPAGLLPSAKQKTLVILSPRRLRAKDLNENRCCGHRSVEILRASSSDALRMTRRRHGRRFGYVHVVRN
jgi:hypothetical protein